MEYNQIKAVIKSKGLRIQDVAKKLGYTYAGLIKGIKTNTLNYNSRLKLFEMLDMINEISDDQNEYKELSKHLQTTIEKLLKQIEFSNDQLEKLAEIIQNLTTKSTQENEKVTKKVLKNGS